MEGSKRDEIMQILFLIKKKTFFNGLNCLHTQYIRFVWYIYKMDSSSKNFSFSISWFLEYLPIFFMIFSCAAGYLLEKFVLSRCWTDWGMWSLRPLYSQKIFEIFFLSDMWHSLQPLIKLYENIYFLYLNSYKRRVIKNHRPWFWGNILLFFGPIFDQ
jgi:hypothetical protein